MVGKRVRELRIKRGLSQQDLGLAIGVTKVSVCGYENGTRIANLEKQRNSLKLWVSYCL